MIGEVPAEFDALVKRLTEELPDRLQEEPDPIARIAIFGFPAQFAMLKDRVVDFLNQIFEPTRYQVNANLRGFYFSSGTQEGTPIDQVLGAIGRGFGERRASTVGHRQELLPPRPHHQGDLRRDRLGLAATWARCAASQFFRSGRMSRRRRSRPWRCSAPGAGATSTTRR